MVAELEDAKGLLSTLFDNQKPVTRYTLRVTLPAAEAQFRCQLVHFTQQTHEQLKTGQVYPELPAQVLDPPQRTHGFAVKYLLAALVVRGRADQPMPTVEENGSTGHKGHSFNKL